MAEFVGVMFFGVGRQVRVNLHVDYSICDEEVSGREDGYWVDGWILEMCCYRR